MRILVRRGSAACPGARHGGHRTYECRRCGTVTYATWHRDDRQSAAYWKGEP